MLLLRESANWMMSKTTKVHVFVGWYLKQQSMFLLGESACCLDDVWNNNSPCFYKACQHAGWCLKLQQSMFLLDDVWNNNNSPCFCYMSQHVGWCLKQQQSMFLCFCMVSHHSGWHGWKWAQVVGWQLEQQHSNNPCQVSQHVMWNFHLKLEHQHTQVTIHQNINNDGLWQ